MSEKEDKTKQQSESTPTEYPLEDPTKLQAFDVERWNRVDIENAPYNPRTIDEYAKRKLRDNLKRVGLLQPIVVNRTTGNIVSGHQRLAVMDAIENKDS